MWSSPKRGGYAGRGKPQEVAGIVHPASLAIPRSMWDAVGEEGIRALVGQDADITIIERIED